MDLDNLIFTELKRAHAEIASITDRNTIISGIESNAKAVEMVLRYSKIARREGLLALDEAVQELGEEDPLKQSLLLVVAGTDPDLLSQIMVFKNATLNLTAFDTVTYWVKVFGALSIQRGENPRVIEELLLNMLSPKGKAYYLKYIE